VVAGSREAGMGGGCILISSSFVYVFVAVEIQSVTPNSRTLVKKNVPSMTWLIHAKHCIAKMIGAC